MSSTTTNYGFPKPSYTDFADITVLDSAFDQIDTALKAIENRVLITQTASGTGTVITLTLPTLVNGYTFTFIASANNNGTATTINGKPFYKAGTTTPPTLIAGKAYTAWYDSTNDCFFIKASAEGNTIAGHVLAGDTFSNNNDTGLLGTMPNNGSVSQSLAINGSYTIPKGYHDGTGKVAQSITTKGAQTYTPTTYDQTIPGNQYISGAQTIKGDANLIASNIISGKSIFGVNGSATIQSLGGKITEVKNFTIPGVKTINLTFNNVPILITGLFYSGTHPVYFTVIAANPFGLPNSYFMTLNGEDVSGTFSIYLTGTTLSIRNPFANDMLNGTAVAIC